MIYFEVILAMLVVIGAIVFLHCYIAPFVRSKLTSWAWYTRANNLAKRRNSHAI